MVQDNTYFFEGQPIEGSGRVGVLLIHGLTGTPNEMKLVGKGLHRAGFSVLGMQLEGHCGDVADLNRTTWQDWYRSVEQALHQLRASVDHVFVAGLSMGALLALKVAADHPTLIAGVGVYGPTFRYDGWSIPRYARYLNFLLIWVKRLNILQDGVFVEQPPYGLKDERLRARVVASMFSGDSASAGLAGNPYPALAEMMKLSALVRGQLTQVSAPCLLIHAREDDIAHLNNSLLVQKKVSGPNKLVVLEDSYHLITIDREYKKVIEESVAYFRSVSENLQQTATAEAAA